ncbi:unnamed protein product [Urochloa humidicola]
MRGLKKKTSPSLNPKTLCNAAAALILHRHTGTTPASRTPGSSSPSNAPTPSFAPATTATAAGTMPGTRAGIDFAIDSSIPIIRRRPRRHAIDGNHAGNIDAAIAFPSTGGHRLPIDCHRLRPWRMWRGLRGGARRPRRCSS